MARRVLMFVCFSIFMMYGWDVLAQQVAVYPVKTNGFSLNGSEVTEIGRIAVQACYDAGLKCAIRGETAENVQKEQGYGRQGSVSQAKYIAEFTLTGQTKDKLKLGLPGGFHIGGGYAYPIGGGYIGGGTYTDLSGLGINLSGMQLAGQFTDTVDGTIAYTDLKNKLHLKGAFILGEASGSNAKKLHETFKEMFENFKNKTGQ